MEFTLARPKSELAGKTVKIKLGTGNHQEIDGQDFHVEDWYQNVNRDLKTDWKNLSTWGGVNYANRIAGTKVPKDNEVLYGKVGRFGYLVHVSEIDR